MATFHKDLKNINDIISTYNDSYVPINEAGYINQHKHTRGFNAEIDNEFDKLLKNHDANNEAYEASVEKRNEFIKAVEEKHGIITKIRHNIFEKESYKIIYCDDVLVSSEDKYDSVGVVLKEKRDLKALEDVKRLQGSTSASKNKKIEKILKKQPKVKEYLNYIAAQKKYNKSLEIVKEAIELYDSNEGKKEKLNWSDISDVRRRLSEIRRTHSRSITRKRIDIAIGSFVVKHFKELALSKEGAKETLLKEVKGIPYDKFDLDALVTKTQIAARLHEEWRENRLNKETGTFEPRWKETKMLGEGALDGKNVKKENGKVMIDIANTNFYDLPFDWQLENYAAAEIAFALSKKNLKLHEAGVAGHKIHDEWLSRNPYALNSPLGEAFSKLPQEEKDKDILHYLVALEKTSANTNLMLKEFNRENYQNLTQ